MQYHTISSNAKTHYQISLHTIDYHQFPFIADAFEATDQWTNLREFKFSPLSLLCSLAAQYERKNCYIFLLFSSTFLRLIFHLIFYVSFFISFFTSQWTLAICEERKNIMKYYSTLHFFKCTLWTWSSWAAVSWSSSDINCTKL